MSNDKKISQSVIKFFEKVSTDDISDASKRLEIFHHCAKGIHPIDPWKEVHVVGPAVTMTWAPRLEGYHYLDAPYRHMEVAEKAEPGDILVMDGQGADFGFWGERNNRTLELRKVAGVVIYGSARDSVNVRKQSLPVFCTGICSNSFVLNYDVVGFNQPINCGGAQN